MLEYQEQTMEEKIQEKLHTRVKITTQSEKTIIGKMTDLSKDNLGDYVILKGVEFEGKKFRIRLTDIKQVNDEEEQGALNLDDDTMSVRPFTTRDRKSNSASASSSSHNSRKTTPDREHMLTNSLSGILNLERDEDIDKLEELMNTNQEQPETTEDSDDDDDLDEDEDKEKAKAFIETIKGKLRGKLQAGEVTITDMMDSILSTCEQMNIKMTKEKI